MFGRRALSVAGPTSWISLPDRPRDQTISADSLENYVKRTLCREMLHDSALVVSIIDNDIHILRSDRGSRKWVAGDNVPTFFVIYRKCT